ncbi:MAG TPA: ABC transporter permease, partial [Gammaproteobacteria bacterium]|nr:ABC transporter permease [Gammaproteobacteria bacterium]
MAQAAQTFHVAEGMSLKSALAKAERRNKIRAFLLVVPLLLFVSFTFLAPIAQMMFRSVDNPVVAEVFPETLKALEEWDPGGAPTPPEKAYETLAAELSRGYKDRTVGRAATRLNYSTGGMRSLITKTARQISRVQVGPFMEGRWKDKFLEIDKDWGDREVWTTIKYSGDRYTIEFFLKALDLGYNWDKSIVPEPENRQLYFLTGFDSV